ncbi:MAG: hypothetical protein ACFE0O_14815, partial [Opitutales bacterium]
GFSYLTTALGVNVDEETDIEAARFIRLRSGGATPDRPGKPYDEDLQAHVFPYRDDSSALGRWTSADPLGFPDGPNRHFYAPVPTMGLDPLGLQADRQLISISRSHSRDMIQREEYRITSASITQSSEVSVGSQATFGGGLALGTTVAQLERSISSQLSLSQSFSYTTTKSWLAIGSEYPNEAWSDHPSQFDLNSHMNSLNLQGDWSFDGWEIALPQGHTPFGAQGSPWFEDPILNDDIRFELQTHNFSWHASYWLQEN